MKKYTTIECSRCATCCKEPVVPVTDSDVRRLCRGLSVSAQKIIRFYSVSEMDFDPESELWIKFPYGKRAMGLRRRNSRCIFLNDQNLCSVYPHRAMTCRTFPYMIYFEKDGSIDVQLNDAVNCQRRPVKNTSLKQVMEDVKREHLEDEKYYKLIKKWNSRTKKGGTEEFLKFCGLCQ